MGLWFLRDKIELARLRPYNTLANGISHMQIDAAVLKMQLFETKRVCVKGLSKLLLVSFIKAQTHFPKSCPLKRFSYLEWFSQINLTNYSEKRVLNKFFVGGITSVLNIITIVKIT